MAVPPASVRAPRQRLLLHVSHICQLIITVIMRWYGGCAQLPCHLPYSWGKFRKTSARRPFDEGCATSHRLKCDHFWLLKYFSQECLFLYVLVHSFPTCIFMSSVHLVAGLPGFFIHSLGPKSLLSSHCDLASPHVLPISIQFLGVCVRHPIFVLSSWNLHSLRGLEL